MLALLVLVVATLTVAILPVTGKQVTYTWQPPTSWGLGRVQLMLPAAPESLKASWPCEAIQSVAPPTGGPATRFFSTGFSTSGELSAWVDAAAVSLRLAGKPVLGAALPLRPGACTLVIKYDDRSRDLSITDGAHTVSVPLRTSMMRDADRLEALQITGLEVAPSIRSDTAVEVVARPSTQVWTVLQWVLALSGLFAGAYLWWSFYRVSAPGPTGDPSPRWTASDTVVSLAALAALFLIPPLADDGWVLTTVRAYPQLGFFSNYFTANAAAQPEGFWWTSIERIWMTPLGTSILALRVPSLVITVLCWWVVRRKVLDQVGQESSRGWLRTVSAAAFAVVLLAWTPTLRPEPMVGLLAVVAVLLVLRFRQRPDPWVLICLALVAALAYAAHQTGWIVIGVACAVTPDLLRWRRQDARQAWTVVSMAVIAFVGVALLLMLLKANLNILLQARESFIQEGRHNAVLDEVLRLRGLIDSKATAPLRLLSAMLVPVVALCWVVLVRGGWERSPARLAAGASSLGGMFLVFTSSKWQWHFGATAGVVAIAVALLLQRASLTQRTATGVVGLIGLLGLLATSKSPGWGLQDLRVLDLDEPVLGRIMRVLVWSAVATAALIALHRRTGRQRVLVWVVTTAVTIIGVASLGPIVVDTVRAPATSWPRLVLNSAIPGQCGLASALMVSSVTVPMQKVPGQPVTDSTIESNWSAAKNLPMPPVPDVTTIQPSGAFPIPVATPWYRVEHRGPARTWIHVTGAGTLSYSIDWQGPEGRTGSMPITRIVTAPAWILVELEVPPEATGVRVSWTNSHLVDVVVSPVAVTDQVPVTSLVAGPVLRTPASALYAPCFQQPDISGGAMQRFDWSLGLPFLGQSTAATGVAEFSEQACVDNPSTEAYPPLCWYKVTSPAPQGLRTTTQITQR